MINKTIMRSVHVFFAALMISLIINSSLAATISHSPSQVKPGTFQQGNYTFQNYTIALEGMCIGSDCQTEWPSGGSNISQNYVHNGTEFVPQKATSTGVVQMEVNYASVDTAAGSFTVANDLTVDTDTLFVDSSGDKVGIGTTNPGQKLYINSTGAAYVGVDTPASSEGGIAFYSAGNIRYSMYRPGSSDDLRFYDWGTNGDVITIKYNSGNIGIGTTNPTELLHLEHTTSPSILTNDTTNGVKTVMRSLNNAGDIGTLSNHNLDIRANDQIVMTLNTSGNVGIGTTSPREALEINDTIRLNGASPRMYIKRTNLSPETEMSSGNSNLIGDDSTFTLTDGQPRIGILILMVEDSAGGAHEVTALLSFRSYTSSGPWMTTITSSGSTTLETSTSDLTGTTGTDGVITVSAHDYVIEVENRSGAGVYVKWFIMGD